MAGRANHLVLLSLALLCAAASLCSPLGRAAAVESQPSKPALPVHFPVASDVRLAGDGKQTRFILDLDQPISVHAFPLADPYRVVVDIPQVGFQLPLGIGSEGRGLIKAFRYGLVMPGGSRIVFDLTGPARIANVSVLEAANGQPPRLVLELEEVDRTAFVQSLAPENRPELRPAIAEAEETPLPVPTAPAKAEAAPASPAAVDRRPVIVIDPGHGGPDNGTQSGNESEKNLVLGFALTLRDRIEKNGKYRVVMTRTDDTFVALADRVQFARAQQGSLFISIHADALPRGEGDAQGATVYTLSETASDSEAARLAETENRADVIAGVDLTYQPDDVADILIDLAQRETKTFSVQFARGLIDSMRTVTRLHKNTLKSAGFRVLKAPDVPSVLIELGYVSNRQDIKSLTSADWREHTADSIAQAIDRFFVTKLARGGGQN